MAREPIPSDVSRGGARDSDLARELHSEHQLLEMGPLHPATRGAVQFALELDGENIAALEVRPGFLHRGFEKECESRTWQGAIAYVDRLNYRSSMLCSTAYCLAVEKLLELEAPPRAQWLRVLGCELARIADHLARCAGLCQQLEASTPGQTAIQARELVWDLQEMLCGARVTAHYLRIGGVNNDLPSDFSAAADAKLSRVRELLGEFEAMLTRNRLFVDRMAGVGRLSADDCVRHSVTGPLLRAAGVPLDLRKDEPYLTYAQIDFSVPVGTTGDNYDRYLVVMEEVRQSLAIVERCLAVLAELGVGAICEIDPRVPSDIPSDVAFTDRDIAPELPVGEAYFALESANGELGFYIVSDGSQRPVKLRCRPPSFLNLQALPLMIEGAMLADLPPTFELVNSVAGECDR